MESDAGHEDGGDGVVVRTFLIADVRGYTRFTHAHGDEEAGKLAASFAALVRESVTATGGELIELRGDEALCAFSSARQALRAAVELQTRFRQRVDGEPVFPLGIGIGLAAGEAVPVEGGYRGGALNLAARLCSVAAPGQILASETVTSLAGTFEGARFVERRGMRLKGLDKPVRALEVVPEVALPPVPEVPAAGRRPRRHVLAVAGGAVLAAAVAAAVVASRGSDDTTSVGNAIAAIGRDGSPSYTDVGTTPSTMAVGEGAVWVLNADDRTISRVDSATKGIRAFGTGGIPTDLAVGEGAVWVGNGAETGGSLGNIYMASVSRLDPGSTVPGETVVLPGGVSPGQDHSGDHRAPGASQVAAGAGAAWAINPDLSVSRIDAATGEVVARIPVKAAAIAAGREGVWALSATGPAVIQIDHQRDKVQRTVELPADGLWGLAVGGGSAWTTDLATGVLWRIAPGATPRPIDLGFGIASVAYGGGAVWVTNFVSDEIVRVDPETNKIISRISLAGTPASVAARRDGVGLDRGSIERRRAPSIRLRRRRDRRWGAWRAHRLGPAAARPGRPGNARRSGRDPLRPPEASVPCRAAYRRLSVVRRLDCTGRRVRLPQVRLQREGLRGDKPRRRGDRAVQLSLRVGPDSDRQSGGGPARHDQPLEYAFRPHARWAGLGPRRAGCVLPDGRSQLLPRHRLGRPRRGCRSGARRRVEVAPHVRPQEHRRDRQCDDDSVPEGGERARHHARRVGDLGSCGLELRNARRPRRGGRPDGVFIGDELFANGGAVVKALRARLGPDVVLIAGDSFMPPEELLGAAGRAAVGMYVTTTAVAHEGLSPAGKRFVRDFGRTQPGGVSPSAIYVTEAAQAAEALLAAIARSDGSRASVTEELRGLDVENGILGSFTFDGNGDITPASFTVLRITGGTTRARELPEGFDGAVVDRVVRVPPARALP